MGKAPGVKVSVTKQTTKKEEKRKKKKENKTKKKNVKLKEEEQLALPRTAGHGGPRAGAGRKKKRKGRSNVAHVTRPGLGKKTPVHVTLRALPGRPSLRAELLRKMFERIVEDTRSEDFHVAKYSVQKDHLHLLCEPKDRAALSAGIRRVAIRFARRMNRIFGRKKGKVWGDRYHRHDLKTPREVRNALVYVLMREEARRVRAGGELHRPLFFGRGERRLGGLAGEAAARLRSAALLAARGRVEETGALAHDGGSDGRRMMAA